MQVKSPNAARIKWQQRTAGATEAYKAGIQQPRTSWQQATAAAQPVWIAAITQATGNNSFQNGVNRAGDAKWQQGAIGKGAQRWAPGVAAAGNDYEAGVQPYFTVLQGTTLAPRGPAGSVQNEERSLAVQRALHQAKLTRTGGA